MVKRNNDTIFRTSNHIFIKVLRRNKKQTRQNKTKQKAHNKNQTMMHAKLQTTELQ